MSIQNFLKKKQEGFTLVELLIVIAIIAILAAIAIPQFTKYRMRAYITQLDSDIKNIYTAAQAYLTDNPSETVDNLAKAKSGGYWPSQNISWTTGTMDLSTGLIELRTVAKGIANNNAVVFYNGRINSGSVN